MLEKAGYEAYAVGGCVRDILLGKTPKDWDICTSALPEQAMQVFAGHHIIETGLQHGTITIILEHEPFEITTYRVDGKYTGNRRPEKVKFVNVLKRDLARRDFTVNAMAYNPGTEIVDYYGGQQDLANKKIKCVGNPNKRFQEDALRIIRALRFAAALGFEVEENTALAMQENRKLLNYISAERIAAELNKLLLGNNIRELLLEHFGVLSEVIPELKPAKGFEQNNPYHCYDVLNHILYSVENAPKDVVIRLSMLLHDIGKPKCYSEAGGVGHFYGHPQESADTAKNILSRLKYDNDTIKAVTQLVLYHDSEINCKQHIKRWLNKIGENLFRQLIEVKKADALAKAEHVRQNELHELNSLLILLDEIIAEQQCFCLKDLAVNGSDLIGAGVPQGAKIGVILNKLLDMVIEDKAMNDKAVLLGIAKKMI
jgi:tRNA nucleotidyltransferase (CCA-adding enzyme)